MVSIRLVACAVVALLAFGLPVSAQTQGFRVVPLVKDGQVYVSFDLRDGFTDEIRAAIKSGLKTTYTYTVDLRMEVALLRDWRIATATVAVSVDYDNLRRSYTVEQMVDGRLVEVSETQDENRVRQLMTTLSRLPLFKTSLLEPNREYYVRVAASARPTNGSLLWPFASGTSATARFTYLR